MKVINFKLLNGDEFIAKLSEENSNSDYIVVEQPRALQFQDRGNGQIGASFVPAMIMSDDREVKVYRSAISMYNDNVGAEYEKHYLQSVSGIQLATSLQG